MLCKSSQNPFPYSSPQFTYATCAMDALKISGHAYAFVLRCIPTYFYSVYFSIQFSLSSFLDLVFSIQFSLSYNLVVFVARWLCDITILLVIYASQHRNNKTQRNMNKTNIKIPHGQENEYANSLPGNYVRGQDMNNIV